MEDSCRGLRYYSIVDLETIALRHVDDYNYDVYKKGFFL